MKRVSAFNLSDHSLRCKNTQLRAMRHKYFIARLSLLFIEQHNISMQNELEKPAGEVNFGEASRFNVFTDCVLTTIKSTSKKHEVTTRKIHTF